MVALTFPYDPDSGRVGAATVRSRIRIAGGDPVLLKDTVETTVEPGCGWEGLVTTSGHQLIDGRRAARFEAAMSEEISLGKFAELIVPKKPVRIRVTLTPDLQAPLPGVPIPIDASAPVQTRVISIAIPAIQPGTIELETFSLLDDNTGRPRGGIRARVRFPSIVKPTADELRAVQQSVAFTETGGQSAVEAGAVQRESDGWVIREYTALISREVMDHARVTVEVTATVCGMLLRSSGQLSFTIRRIFQPYIVPHSLSVTPSSPASFTAVVREILPDGREVEVPDASVSVTVPSLSTGFLSIRPETATGTLSATVTQLKDGARDPVSCPVVFRVGKDHYEDAVVVTGGKKQGPLEIEFVPPDKTSLNPFLPGDSITLRARVQSGTAAISFARGSAAHWLDDPSSTVLIGDGWVAVRVEASPPDPGSQAMPPESEPVIVTASENGEVIAEESVPVRFTTPPLLDASPDIIRILAGREGDGAEVVLSLHGEAPGSWKFELEEEEDASRHLSISDPVSDGTTAKFTVRLSGEQPRQEKEVGPSSWQTVYTLHSRASDGTTEVEGPVVKVILLREGLFVEKIFAVDEKNQYKTSDRMTVLPIRVDLPTEDRKRVARVKLVALVWNGTELVQDDEAVRGENLSWDPPVCTAEDSRKWEIVFTVLKARLVITDRDEAALTLYSGLEGTWGISLDKIIPGRGENMQGEITVHNDVGTVTIPIVLRLGEMPDEKTLVIEKEKERCIRVIQACIPKDHRQSLLDDLEKLPYKGARDYQVYAREVYYTAWEIWAVDQKNYLWWDSGWGGKYIFLGAEYAKVAGDISFSLLVGYAIKVLLPTLPPSQSYGASLMASTFKEQGLEFYAYYVGHNDTKDFRTCIIDFVNERLTEFLVALSSGAVDTVVLKGIDIRNPKTYTRLAWLWLWKVDVNLARKPEAGLVEAMISAGKEVAMTAGMMLLQEFVNTHGSVNLRDLHKSVKKKGLLGPGQASGDDEGEKETRGKKPDEKKKPGAGRQSSPPGHTSVKSSTETLKKAQSSRPNEVGAVYDAEGNLLQTKEGSPKSITWDTPPEKMKGGTMIHTHPNDRKIAGKPNEKGGAHSATDLTEAVNNQLAESIVIGDNKVYRVKVNNKAIDQSPTYRGKSRGKLALEIKEAYDKAQKEITPELVKKGNAEVNAIRKAKGSASPDDVNRVKEKMNLELKERIVERVAEQFGEFISFESLPK